MMTKIQHLTTFMGLGRNTTSHREKLLSALGALTGIAVIYWLTSLSGLAQLTHHADTLIVASMGASAVLLFAVPHGALSQPWPVLGGHLISALIGVACQRWLPGGVWTAALAVGLAVGAMAYLRCIHPPGGATALTAVIGGSSVHNLGFDYIWFPVMMNAVALLIIAIIFNSPFAWRRYPEHLARHFTTASSSRPAEREVELTQEDFNAAMAELDSYFDITTESLTDLLELAKQHAEKNIDHPTDIVAGRFYSNGKLGALWSIRQVVDAAPTGKDRKDRIIYKVIEGAGDYETGLCQREEFRQWARFEVETVNGRWVKVQ